MNQRWRNFINYCWIPIRDFLKDHYFLVMIASVLCYLFVQFQREPSPPPIPAVTAPALPKKTVTVAGEVEDANSAFAKNALGTLDKQEYTQYGRFFYSMMNSMEGEGVEEWTTPHASGVISASASFEGAYKSQCRRYAERYTVGEVIQERSGITCKDKKTAAWCKLRTTSLPTCELNRGGGITEFFSDTEISIHDLQLKTGDIMYRLQHLF